MLLPISRQPLAHPAKWQRVEQFLEPVVCRVVDVRILTQELTQPRRVRSFVGLEISQIVQRHQNDETVLAHPDDVVMKCNVELLQTVRAAKTSSRVTSQSVHFTQYSSNSTGTSFPVTSSRTCWRRRQLPRNKLATITRKLATRQTTLTCRDGLKVASFLVSSL